MRRNPTRPTARTAAADLRFATPIFNTSTRRVLRYHEEGLGFTATSGVPTQYFFTANGVYDPNVTGTGHQPIGFDQMMLFYEQCTVVRSKITVDILNSNSGPISRTCLFLTPDAAVLTDPNRILENGQAVTKITYNNVTWGSVASLSMDCDIAAYFGRPRTVRNLLQDDNLFCTAAANPVEQVYYAVGGWDPFGSNTLGFFFNVTIEYDTVFWEPRKLTES